MNAQQWPFPFLIPITFDRLAFAGYIGPSSHRDKYEFSIQLDHSQKMNGAIIKCCSSFTERLGNTGLNILKERLQSSPSIEIFLVELDDLIVRGKFKKFHSNLLKTKIYSSSGTSRKRKTRNIIN